MTATFEMEARLWTASEVAAATGGHTSSDWAASGVSIDSRTVRSGDLFVAIRGPRFDGHDFVKDALAKGAVAALVASVPETLESDPRLVTVQDTFEALESLGGAARDRTNARVIAVTGSVGKTGVKEALRMVLGRHSLTLVSEGSLNNHLGVPLSLARLPRDAGYGVFEMGMNHAGEIGPLSRMARPHVALITTVEAVHIEFFRSVDEIADAKAEVFEGLIPGGTAILNRDNRYFDHLSAAALENGAGRVIGFGRGENAELRILEERPEADGSTVRAKVLDTELTYRVGIPGRHWVTNSAAVLATTLAAGGEVAIAADALAQLVAPQGRGQRHTVQLRDGGSFELIDESYNASPTSVRAAIELLRDRQPHAGGRRIAALGDMLELGEATEERHAELSVPLREAGIDLVFVAGSHMGHLWAALNEEMKGLHTEESTALASRLASEVRSGDVVMVKGSAGSRMREVVTALLALHTEEEGTLSKRAVNGS